MKSSARKVELASASDLFSTEQERQDAKLEKIRHIPLAELHPFPDHPFSVKDDDSMKETVESIKERGVLQPVIARPREGGGYELVSGHRRKRACELAGLDTMPVIVRDLDRDTAIIFIEWKNTPITAQIQITKKSADYNPTNGLPAGTLLEGEIVRFEVTNKALATGVSITKTGPAEIMAGQPVRYVFSDIANGSNVRLDNFYWRDTLPAEVRLDTVVTGTYNFPGVYKITYRVNGGEYRTLADNLSIKGYAAWNFFQRARPMIGIKRSSSFECFLIMGENVHKSIRDIEKGPVSK